MTSNLITLILVAAVYAVVIRLIDTVVHFELTTIAATSFVAGGLFSLVLPFLKKDK